MLSVFLPPSTSPTPASSSRRSVDSKKFNSFTLSGYVDCVVWEGVIGEGVLVMRFGGVIVGGALWGPKDSGRRWLHISEARKETSGLCRDCE